MATREEELTGRQWRKKSTLVEPRLSELVRAYRRLGYEIHLEPFDPSQQADCSGCMKVAAVKYKTIYVRKITAGQAGKDESF